MNDVYSTCYFSPDFGGQIKIPRWRGLLDVINDPCCLALTVSPVESRRNLTSSGECRKDACDFCTASPVRSYSRAKCSHHVPYCCLAKIKAKVLNDRFFHEISQWKHFKHVQCNLLDLCRMFRYLGALPGLEIKHVVIGKGDFLRSS